MPAERSKCNRRSGEDVPQLVWTIPVEPTTVYADGTAFNAGGTSVNFDDGPPPLVDPCDFILFPPTDGSPPTRKAAHSKKKPEDHIPRPPNAFILFRSSFIKGQHVPTEVETNHSTLSKIIGLTWKNLPNDERLFWHAKAKAALDEHKRRFPQYAFRPAQGRGKGGEKRKVREVGLKDHKRCAKIAELLVEGKKGQELDIAIQEFDKHHVPEVVTRFEAPLTARMYRRSSSVPVPDSEDGSKGWPSRKSRSASTQPTLTRDSSPDSSPSPETKQEAVSEAACMSSFDQYSFPAQESPSFDLNAFSFDNPSLPTQTYLPCDPLSDSVNPVDSGGILFGTNDNLGNNGCPDLSINTSFLGIDDWNCPSPLSTDSSSMPATPSSFMGSPSPDAYGSYTLESFEHSLAKSFEGHFPTYPSSCDSQYLGVFEADSPSAYPTFEPCSKVHMANQDFVFSAFMASLPEYAL
ncbi:Repressor ROX1 [Hypsizygus marmoreus]|uniref:Repressor ROX1 n=1 Tax=Hypsizygus marmoreus TaxID=39966 RepID=A0A369JL39_HYPMA|nr:Repressor ROX1 [Hypsizygus marmoreus]